MTAGCCAATSSAGIAVTALIVPKDLGYAGIAGVPLQNGLYAAAAGALFYALFCTSRQISTGPSSSLAAVAGGAVIVDRPDGRSGRAARRGDHAGHRRSVPADGRLQARAHRAVPVQGGGDRLPGGRGDRRGDRRAAEADRAPTRRARTRGASSGPGSARWTTRTARRCSSGSRRWRVILGLRWRRARGAGRARARRRRPARVGRSSTSARTAWRWWATFPAGCRRRSFPTADVFTDHAATIAAAAVALLLIGFSQTAGDARAFATRHRYQIDVDQESVAQGMANVGAGRLPGDAGLDEPVGELAERVGRCADAAGLARHRRARGADAARPRAGLLGPAQAGARRADHRRGGVRDDRRRASCGACAASARRLRDRRGRHRRRAVDRACSPASCSVSRCRSAGWCTSRRRRRCRCSAASEHRCVPRARRAPRGRDVPRHRRAAARRRAVLRDGRRAARAATRRDGAMPSPSCTRWCSTSAAWTSSTARAPRSSPSSPSRLRDGVVLRLAHVKTGVLRVLAADGVLEQLGADRVHVGLNDAVEAQLALDARGPERAPARA